MRADTGYSLVEIQRPYAQKRDFEKQFPLSYFFFRPISFYLAWLLLKITRSPSRVAFLGLGVGIAGCLSLVRIPEWSPWPGLLLLFVYDLLDAADGNIARVTGNVTCYGKFLDGVIGEIVEGTYCFFLAAGLYRAGVTTALGGLASSGGEYARVVVLLAGTAAMGGRLFSGQVAGSYHEHLERQELQEGKRSGSGRTGGEHLTEAVGSSRYRNRWWYLVDINVSSFDFQILALVAFVTLGLTEAHVLFYGFFYLVQSVLFVAFYLHRARTTLR